VIFAVSFPQERKTDGYIFALRGRKTGTPAGNCQTLAVPGGGEGVMGDYAIGNTGSKTVLSGGTYSTVTSSLSARKCRNKLGSVRIKVIPWKD